jgi:hypothetical protein
VANHARTSRQSLEELTAEQLDLSFADNLRTTFYWPEPSQPGTTVGQAARDAVHLRPTVHLRPAPRRMPAELAYVASKGALTSLVAAHVAGGNDGVGAGYQPKQGGWDCHMTNPLDFSLLGPSAEERPSGHYRQFPPTATRGPADYRRGFSPCHHRAARRRQVDFGPCDG